MTVQTMSKPFAKEVSEVMDLLVVIVADLRAKKKLDVIAADALPKLMSALEGVDQMPEEFKQDLTVALATCGYSLGELVGAIVKPPAQPPV